MRPRRDKAGQSPIIKDAHSSLLEHVMNCTSQFIIRPLRDCGSSRFTRPSFSILRLRDHRSSRFNLGSGRFCLTAKNQTISDDTNWQKKVTMSLVPSALRFASWSNRASHCHMFPHRKITLIMMSLLEKIAIGLTC